MTSTGPSRSDARDRLVLDIRLSGDGGWPAFMHPGGMQIVDEVLAVALEAPYGVGPERPFPEDIILFIDVSSPEQPRPLSQFPAKSASTDFGKAGVVGLTPALNPLGPGLRYLMISTGGDNGDVRLWRSLSTTDAFTGPSDPRQPERTLMQGTACLA